jgi:hypothetical protein
MPFKHASIGPLHDSVTLPLIIVVVTFVDISGLPNESAETVLFVEFVVTVILIVSIFRIGV